MPVDVEDRFCGCLVGLAVGDALGGPVERMSAQEIESRYGGPLTEMVGGGWLHLQPGEYTDETQLMICVAESIATRGTFDPEDVVRRLIAWYESNPKDVGGITDSTLSRAKRGGSLRDATYAAHLEHKGASAGNGALMRSVPLALLYLHEQVALMIASRESARLTHWHDLSAHGAAALNLSIARVLQGDDLHTALKAVQAHIRHASPAVLHAILAAHDRATPPSTTGYVLDSLTITWHAVLHSRDFESAVTYAVNLGGDADTQGALAGALAGALYGFSAIPDHWLEPLQDRAHIEGLARRIYARTEPERRSS